ncbi:hypothetical protein, partial [Peribacillus simplex]|uniref:hypothetical protein n=1 Tax=Peribacillus simplex TaxID=1478 RepID=UPI003D267FF1
PAGLFLSLNVLKRNPASLPFPQISRDDSFKRSYFDEIIHGCKIRILYQSWGKGEILESVYSIRTGRSLVY